MEAKENDLILIRDYVKGDIIIKENIQFNNIEANSIIIEENVTARLFGKVKNVILKKGSRLIMHGLILGKVENLGGELLTFKSL